VSHLGGPAHLPCCSYGLKLWGHTVLVTYMCCQVDSFDSVVAGVVATKVVMVS
jgi:hypothetical protein